MFKQLLKFFYTYVVLLLVLLGLLVLSCMIPSRYLRDNIGISIRVFETEGIYTKIGPQWRTNVTDNFGDLLMLNTAYSVSSDFPMISALTNIRHEESDNYLLQIENLKQVCNDGLTSKVEYSRYWHGYLVYLRPLLVVFSYAEIRVLLTALLFFSLGVFLYNSWYKTSRTFFSSVVLGLLAVDVLFVGWSIHISGIFILSFVVATYMLRTFKQGENLYSIFFVSGILTVFIDLLSAPIFVLGLLLLISAELQNYSARKLLLNALSWFIGWSGFWLTKWLLVELVIPGSISTAFHNVLLRTGSLDSVGLAHQEVIKYNLFYLLGNNPPVLLTLVVVVFLVVVKFHNFRRDNLPKIVVLSLLGLLPYVWYLFAANHAYIHFWFTYRDQFITVACFFLILANVVDLQSLISQFVYRVKIIYQR